jgi:DNA-directed RNA polymerase specialized sigma subunit
MNVGSVVNDDMKVQTSKSYDTMGDTVASICDREDELKEKMDAYAKIERKVSEKIDEVKEQKYRDLLRYRYILGLTYDQIADRMNYSPRHIARMHDKAVEAFEAVHGGNYT